MTITQIKRWGNSHAIRIPKNLLEALNLTQDSLVEITQGSGVITLTPVEKELSLEELLLQITPENIHNEIDSVAAVGAEAW